MSCVVVLGTRERTLCVVPEKLPVVFSYGKQNVSLTFSCGGPIACCSRSSLSLILSLLKERERDRERERGVVLCRSNTVDASSLIICKYSTCNNKFFNVLLLTLTEFGLCTSINFLPYVILKW